MRLTAATDADCAALAETSRRAFLDDVRFGAPEAGGPPGFDAEEWHKNALTWGDVYVLHEGDHPVGGAIVFHSSATGAQLSRIWLIPECQGSGLGREAMAAVESLYPDLVRWTLDTPSWNLRTEHFYRRCGYVEIGTTASGEVLFEKNVTHHSSTP